MKRYQLHINGAWSEPDSGKWFETRNPYSGEAWGEIPHAAESDVERAVDAASKAFDIWRKWTPTARGKCLVRLAEIIEDEALALAETEVRDNGKLLAEMAGQVTYLAEWYRYFGGLADKIEGAVLPSDKADIFNFTRYEPLGVVGMITPWNSPLLLLSWKLAAALAAGNTAVIKPSEFTSASTLEFVDLFARAGFPAGVVNVVTGFGQDTGAAIVSHPKVAKVAFTGSDFGGQKVYESAARSIKHVSLELGGKSPNIVFEDADLEAAVMGVISGIFAASGQSCIAGSRLLLQRSIHDRFVDRLVEVASQARLGDPMSSDINVGPVTTEAQYRKVLEYIDIAKSEGANCILGGKPWKNGGPGGQFVEPTIFTGVHNKMRIAQDDQAFREQSRCRLQRAHDRRGRRRDCRGSMAWG